GIKTIRDTQIVFVDTPGLHTPRTLMNQRMVAIAEHAIDEADVRLWVVDAIDGVTPRDRSIAERLRGSRPTCVALNKIDRLSANQLLPQLAALDSLLPGHDVVPVSALAATNLDELLVVIRRLLPSGPRYYDPETFTDQTERMLAQEAVREQVLLQTRDEVPYAVAVTVEQFEDKERRADGRRRTADAQPVVTGISATIHVERAGQKAVL